MRCKYRGDVRWVLLWSEAGFASLYLPYGPDKVCYRGLLINFAALVPDMQMEYR